MTDSAAMRRRLRVEIRRLRNTAGLTQREVANALEWSPSKVIRIESGQVGVSVTDLRALAGLFNVNDKERITELESLARGSRRQPFSEYRDVIGPDTIRFFGYEASASLIRNVHPLIVPGLLQTEEYTRSLLRAYRIEEAVVDRVVESRRERQELLDRSDPPSIFTIVDESVLRRQVGGIDVIQRQLQHLAELADRPHITIQVVPFTVGAYAATQGAFVHLEFPDVNDPDVVFLDGPRNTATFIDDPETTGQYQETFMALEDLAAPAKDLSKYIEDAVKSFGRS